MANVSTPGILFRRHWRFYVGALAISSLLVWSVEQIVVDRGFKAFQEHLSQSAAHLADGRKKMLVLGSMITVGRFDATVKATAQGFMPPDNPAVLDALKRLDHTFDLAN